MREYKRNELVAVDLCALWNAKKRKPLDNVWRGLSDQYLVLPHEWLDDLLKHHVSESRQIFADFLACGLRKERILIAELNEDQKQYDFRSLAQFEASPTFVPDGLLDARVAERNELLLSRYRGWLANHRDTWLDYFSSLPPDAPDAFRRLRSKKTPANLEDTEQATQHLVSLVRMEREAPGAELQSLGEQRYGLAAMLIALRESRLLDHEHLHESRSDYQDLNDLFDIAYMLLGADLSDLKTRDKRLRKSYLVYERVVRTLQASTNSSQ